MKLQEMWSTLVLVFHHRLAQSICKPHESARFENKVHPESKIADECNVQGRWLPEQHRKDHDYRCLGLTSAPGHQALVQSANARQSSQLQCAGYCTMVEIMVEAVPVPGQSLRSMAPEATC